METVITARKIPLLENGEAYLIFDYLKGEYRVAFYFPVKGKREKKRYTTTKPNLRDAISECFRVKDSPFINNVMDKTNETEGYIRATPWGMNLP